MPTFNEIIQSAKTAANPMGLNRSNVGQYAQSGIAPGGSNPFTEFIQSSQGLSDQEYQTQLNELYQKYKGSEVGSLFEQELYSGGARRRASQLADPNSQIYKQFGGFLQKQLAGQTSTDKFIAGNRARGLSTTGSGIIGEEQQQAAEMRARETASKATQQFYLSNIGQSNTLLNSIMQNKLGRAQLAEQKSQFDRSQPGVGDLLGGIAGYAAGGLVGGGVGYLNEQIFGE